MRREKQHSSEVRRTHRQEAGDGRAGLRKDGFRTDMAIELALYHNLGRLPEPESTPER